MEFESKPYNEGDVVRHFQTLKAIYARQRESFERDWSEALRSYQNSADMEKSYDGYSDIRIPETDKKVNAIQSRVESIIFNVTRLGRIEPMETTVLDKDIVKLQNRYIFEHQLEDIGFTSSYQEFNLLEIIQGTAVAKITQEYEERDLGDGYSATVCDNTYFRTIPLMSFYSDVTKQDIRKSAANIHSTEISLSDLWNNQKRMEVDPETGEEYETGVYFNLQMLSGSGISPELKAYLNLVGINDTQTASVTSRMADTQKTGIVQIDECYGMYDINGDGRLVESLVTIANGAILIRAQATPFKHNRHVRPFIVGRYKTIPHILYGESNVIKTLPMIMELNGARSMISDSRKFSIFPMLHIDSSAQMDWDGEWRPMGVIKSIGGSPVSPIVNPSNIGATLQDCTLIQRDIDEVWSISPIQQGITDRRYIPDTARQTNALIAQNEFPVDSVIVNKVNNELKVFFEMLFERNMMFKSPEEIIGVFSQEEIEMVDLQQLAQLPALLPKVKIKVVGNMKLSQELSTKAGYERLLALSKDIPNLARRIDYKGLTDKLLASYGILDDSTDIFIPESTVQEVLMQEQKQKQQMQQVMQVIEQQQQSIEAATKENEQMKAYIEKMRASESRRGVQEHLVKNQIDLQKEIALEQVKTDEATKRRVAESEIEGRTGSKVN